MTSTYGRPTQIIADAHRPETVPGLRLGRALAVQGLIFALAAAFHAPVYQANFGVVDPDRVFRSAQLEHSLDRTLDTQGIASILNLRGGSQNDAWYAHEIAASQHRGIDFYDVSLRHDRRPSRSELLALLDLFDRCRYPLLIHCKSGADRTGLVSGLYLMAKRGVPPQQAERAFTIRHSHIPLLGPERLHEPFREYADWLKAHKMTHSPQVLRQWVATAYISEPEIEPVGPIRPGSRLASASAGRR